MKMTGFLRTATAALTLAILSSGASASTEAWEQADEAYQAQRYTVALAMYEQLAQSGDARAAELAGHMLALGEPVYGDSVRRDPARAVQLLAQAAHAGRPIATHLLRNVERATVAAIANK